MNSLDAFAGAPVKMRNTLFAKIGDAYDDLLDLVNGRLDQDWHKRVQDNSWRRSALRAADDFEAVGMDQAAEANRSLARGERV